MKKRIRLFLCLCMAAVLLQIPAATDAAAVSAKAYIVMEATTGRVVAAGNENTKLPIASTTKILTALIALEQPNLYEQFTVDKNAIKVEGTSMGLREGDKANLFALANGMLLSSGNDGANAAGAKIAGSVKKFADVMNARAAQIGMKNSHFVTPSGLHDEQHYSTAYDMALLAAEAIRNETFLSICSQTKVRVEYGNPPYTRYLSNHNRLLKSYEGCIGIKTGFTKKAGRCLVSAARRNGVTLICVTLNDPNDWRNHTNLLDAGFKQVKPIEIPVPSENIQIPVVGGAQKTIAVKPLAKTYACIENAAKLETKVYASPFRYAPVSAGDIIGEMRHYYQGRLVATTDLVAASDIAYVEAVPKVGFWKRVGDFFKSWF